MALLTLPEPIFSEIMLMVGLESPVSLLRCMKVCPTWNETIMRDIWDSQSKKNKIMKRWFELSWGPGMFPSDEEIEILATRSILNPGQIQSLNKRIRRALFHGGITEVTCAASLAHHGLLGPVANLDLSNVDLSEVPAQHLASLASCVGSFLKIWNVSGGQQIISLLTNLKCDGLVISRQFLGQEETQALVQALESGVKLVWLFGGVTLDVEALSEYSGQGVCRVVEISGDTAARHREELRNWTSNRNWRVVEDIDKWFVIQF